MSALLRCVTNMDLPATWNWGKDKWSCQKSRDLTVEQLIPADLVIINGNIRQTAFAAALRRLVPRARYELVLLDVVLRRPTSVLKQCLLRKVLDQVDYFVHYFNDLKGYARFYGITNERSGYIPFKPNLSRYPATGRARGEYVLCFGRSMRDYDLFFRAVEVLPLPGAIPWPNRRILDQHGSKLTLPVPPNVRLLDDDGSSESLIRILHQARIVALPIREGNICASGIGTYLNAMLYSKPVIITAGPGTSDVLKDEAVFVEPADAGQLRSAIYALWHDEQWAAIQAQRGYEYARSLGGVKELCSRVLEIVMGWHYREGHMTAMPYEAVREGVLIS